MVAWQSRQTQGGECDASVLVGCRSLRLSPDQVPQRKIRQTARVALEERSSSGGRVSHSRIFSDLLIVYAAHAWAAFIFLK